MKTRLGFVSNSSSCSFVLLGVKISAKEMDMDYSELIETIGDDFDFLTDEDVSTLSEDELIIGQEIIREVDDETIEEAQYSIFELIDIGKEISTDINKKIGKDMNIELKDLKLYTGIKMC